MHPRSRFHALSFILIPVLLLLLSGCRELQDLRHIKQIQDQRIRELEQEMEQKAEQRHQESRQQQAKIESLQEQLEAARGEVRKGQEQRSDRERRLADEAAQARTQLEQAQAEIKRLKFVLKDQTSEVEQKQSTTEELQEQLSEAQTRVEELEAKNEQLESNRKEARDKLDPLTKQLEEAQAELEQVKSERDDLQAQLSEQKDKVAGLEKRIAELEKESEKTAAAPKTAFTMTDDFQEAYDLLKRSLKPVSDANYATVSVDEDRGVVVRLAADYLFKKDALELDPDVLATLDGIAKIMSRVPNAYVEVQGHTDSQPVVNFPFVDNWGLAAARAERVVRYLANETPLSAKRLKGSSCAQYRSLPASVASKSPLLTRRVEIILSNHP